MLKINEATKKFGKKKAVNNVSFELNNCVYGLLGPNGAGKTTLLRCLVNIYPLNNGAILYDDKNIKKLNNYNKSIGYLPQKFGLFKELKVFEMLSYICAIKKIPKTKFKEEIEKVLELVNLSDKLKDKISTLSGGMIRRLGIAQALLYNPEIIVLDEPTAGLDPEERARLKSIISLIRKDRIIIISTHIVEDVEALCDEIIVMNNGEIVFIGSKNLIREKAENKVYIASNEAEDKINGNYFIEKVFDDGENKKIRFLSNEKQEFKSVSPSIEDGYLCILKNI